MRRHRSLIPLGEIVDGWPSSAATLEDLVNLPKETLRAELENVDESTREAVWALRAHARTLVSLTQTGGDSLHSPNAVLDSLRQGRLVPRSGYWTVYPLKGDLRRVAAPYKPGGTRYLVKVLPKFPETFEDLEIGEGDDRYFRYLVIWGGDTSVLGIPGVAERIVKFGTAERLVDVIFWNPEEAEMVSLRYGFGDHRGEAVGFPTEVAEAAAQARNVWSKGGDS